MGGGVWKFLGLGFSEPDFRLSWVIQSTVVTPRSGQGKCTSLELALKTKELIASGPISQITSSGVDSALAGCPKRGIGQDGQLAGIEERAKLAAQRCKKVVEISQKSNLAARRFCCGLGEPSFESRFAK